jgi:hypothetical protein
MSARLVLLADNGGTHPSSAMRYEPSKALLIRAKKVTTRANRM